ncbi:MAG: metallophosphoesterase family protein [Candidatus Methanofastidiosia archaeon]
MKKINIGNNIKKIIVVVLLIFLVSTPIYAQPQKDATIGCSEISVQGAIFQKVEDSTAYLRAYDNVVTIMISSSCNENITFILSNVRAQHLSYEGIDSLTYLSQTIVSFSVETEDVQNIELYDMGEGIEEFSFVVVGDNRDGPETFAKILEEINDTKYMFCINTGDIVPSGRREQFEAFMELVGNLKIPLYISIGNHELNNNSCELASEFLGDLTYSFDFGNTHFIILDNSTSRVSENDYLWMKQDIDNTDKENIILACHIPPYDPREDENHCLLGEEATNFVDFMSQNGVDVVFAGHIHLYDERDIEGVHYVITAGGGAPLYALEAEGGFFHYIIATVSGSEISFEVVKIISPKYTPEIASEKINLAEDSYNNAFSIYETAKNRCDNLNSSGEEVGIYLNKLEIVNSNLETSLSCLQLAQKNYEDDYWHDSIVSANAAYSYALQAKISAETILKALENIKPENNFTVYAAVGVCIFILVVGSIWWKSRNR